MNQVLKRVLLLLVSLLLVTYAAFQIYHAFGVTTVTETVERTTAYYTVDTMGVVFREETVIPKQGDGYFFYTIADGNRVAKSGTIANVFPSLQDALGQQQLDALDEEISTLASINAQGTSNRANLASINQQINTLWLSVAQSADASDYASMSEYRTKLLALLNKKQLTIGRETDFNDRLAELRARREALAASFTKATSKVSAPAAGYFISRVDGFEGLLTTKGVTNVTTEQLQQYLNMEPAAADASIGKVVGDYEWYLGCVVPLEQTALFKKGSTLNVRLPFVMDQTVPMEVAAINKAENDSAAVILKCTHMSGELSAIRREQVELRVTTYSGLRIPDEAIYFNENQESGVYVQDGNLLRFRKLRVLYHDADERYSVCEVIDDRAYVQLYDRIVTKGEDLYDGKSVR